MSKFQYKACVGLMCVQGVLHRQNYFISIQGLCRFNSMRFKNRVSANKISIQGLCRFNMMFSSFFSIIDIISIQGLCRFNGCPVFLCVQDYLYFNTRLVSV